MSEKETPIKTIEIELAVASYFGYRQNLIVPNVSWGLNIHECDLFIVSAAGYATEVEIKISKADLKKDALKPHGHESDLIKNLYFAIPEKLVSPLSLKWLANHVPERAGIITLKRYEHDNSLRCGIIRKPMPNKNARKLTDEERYKVARLGALRIWGFKHRIIISQQEGKP